MVAGTAEVTIVRENQFTELFVNNPALESYNSMKL